MPACYLIRALSVCLPLVASCSSFQDLDLPTAPRAEAEDPAPPAARPTRTITVYLGERSFDSDFAPVEDQPALGIEFSSRPAGSSVGWEVGFQTSQDDAVDPFFGTITLDATVSEFYGGARMTFNQESDFRPYVGGGLSILTGDLELSDGITTVSDDDTVLGFYVHGGIAYSFTQGFALGLDYRLWVGDELDIFGFDLDANYDQFALTLGFSF